MIRDVSVGKRAGFAFGSIGAVILLLASFSMFELSKLGDEFEVVASHRIPALDTSTSMLTSFLNKRLQTANVLMAKTEQQREDYLVNLRESKDNFDKSLDKMVLLAKAEDANGLLNNIRKHMDTYDTSLTKQLDLVANERFQEAEALQNGKMKNLRELITSDIRNLVEFQEKRITDSNQDVQSAKIDALTILIITSIVSLFIVITFSILFTRSLTLPMRVAVDTAKKIASGDLTSTINDNGKDETADMLSALKEMQGILRETINEIQLSSSQLAATSEELSAVTEQSTRGIHTQTEQLEQAVSAVTELSVAVDEVARNAESTSNESENANQRANIGKARVLDTVNTVDTLLLDLDTTTKDVNSLAEQVANIGSVLDVIRTIAEQTNLLALNAAIEAARAGESGRGFAVVADEVRSLASRTQESTTEIEAMIQAVKSNTDNTVSAIRNSHERAKAVLEVANQAGDALHEITSLISIISEQNLSIASSTEQQAIVARDVDKNLVTIRDISSETAAGANETAASNQELARLAQTLNELTSRFVV
ncbi:methyl-accepting chemotaxis protein [Pseudoalteromonas sp. JB197]|uniref:methyl-accepting chemotaxis protein n=1 Tax=Pseudoalteromonas sp. JB197 TaxID=1434839 RepID=UPI00097E985A|nr:methyl-accepting chemotaxis protein [Pseudoalteromonas sp. JB197]PCC14473.1 methyl-accepting chemotaxis protein [Pseudoalteromonas sp. JB197]SJN36414.1 Methyl-accepting chemotaxis protein I (serine chemoreceptor protein) [Pseudoalteromonas sp. JB197]